MTAYELATGVLNADNGRKSVPLDERNPDYQAFLKATGKTHDEVVAESETARAAQVAAAATARSTRRSGERADRLKVKAWLGGTGDAPTLRQLADAINSIGDDE